MKVFVFKPSNEPIGKFEISDFAAISEGFHQFAAAHAVGAYDYLECSGRTWTVVDGASGLEIQEGRQHPPKAAAGSRTALGSSRPKLEWRDLTAEYLHWLRTHSACKELHGSIAATFWFNIILWLIAGLGCIILLSLEKSTELDKAEAKIGLVIVFFAVNALVVYRQIALMVVTVADSIVLRNRDADGGYETQRQRSSQAAQQ